MSIIEKAKEYISKAFGDEKSGAKAGGIAAVLGLGAMGFLAGDFIGAIVGLGVGLVAAPFVNDIVAKNTGDTAAPVTLRKPAANGLASDVPDVAPERPEVRVQEDAIEASTLSVGGRNFTVNLPKTESLKRPWQGQSAESYIGRIRSDTLEILKNPVNKSQDVPTLHKMVTDRNKPYYQFMATVAGYHSEFEKYNTTTRREMMKELGLDDKDSQLPPAYDKKLELQLDKSLLDDVRVREEIGEDKWNKMSSVEQLSYVENSMSKRMIEVSKKYAKLKMEMEAHERKVPIDFDLSFSSGLNRLSNLISLGYAPWTAENRAEKAIKNFYEGKPEHQHTHPLDKSRKIIIRDEKAAEDEFRNAMEALITEFDAKGQFGGEMNAAQARELISILIEERRVHMEWNGIQATKQMWADSAERWLEDAKSFKTSLTDYAAKYAGGAGSNASFTLLNEFTMPIVGNSNTAEIKRQLEEAKKAYQPLFDRDYKAFEAAGKKGEFKTAADTDEALNKVWAIEDSLRQAEEIESLKKRARAIKLEMKAGIDATRKAVDGAKQLIDQLNGPNMLTWTSVDMERSIMSLPTFREISGQRQDEAPADAQGKLLQDAADRLSAVLGTKVSVSIHRKDEAGRPMLEIGNTYIHNRAKLHETLIKIRNDAGFTKDNMPVNRWENSWDKDTSYISSAYFVEFADAASKGEQPKPTKIKDDVLAKFEARKEQIKTDMKPLLADKVLRQDLEKAAENYNTKLKAFQANTGDTKANAELRVAHESLANAIHDYIQTAGRVHKVVDEAQTKTLQEIEKQSVKGTPLQGAEGFGMIVKDKRGSKPASYVLRGIKKDGKHIVTGVSTFKLDEDSNKTVWFGSDITDIAKGIEFDPKNMSGLESIIAKINGSPTAMTMPKLQPDVLVRARESVAFVPMAEPDTSFLPNNVMQFAREMPRLAA